jgi:CHAT domain-containing protein
LQRAFTIAGARVVLMSLWTVSDEATQVLMTNFYGQLFKGKPITQAFALAQQETRKQYAHPYYWSAFVLLGK